MQMVLLTALGVGGATVFGAVLGFVPQILVLFTFLSFLEACGYMSRIAFVMDKVFRKFGLSGKSFIPLLLKWRQRRLCLRKIYYRIGYDVLCKYSM